MKNFSQPDIKLHVSLLQTLIILMFLFLLITAQKVSVFGDFLVRIFPHPGLKLRIRTFFTQ